VNVAIVVPVLDAAKEWPAFSAGLLDNLGTCGISSERVLIIDSSSSDGTKDLVRTSGFKLHIITKSEFNHGATRQLALEVMKEAEVFVYLTQDAALAEPSSIQKLLEAFADPLVAACYGRQLPKLNAGAMETHARLFNYPNISCIRNLNNRKDKGIKSIFLSNSFSAYRREALMDVGGFPEDVIFGEDTVVTGRFHINGWKTAYVAEATVYHSHSYSFMQEFRRYFDVGVLHSRESWLLEQFGDIKGEGKKFVLSELQYLWNHQRTQIPSAIIRTWLKVLAYRLGRNEARMSFRIKSRLSMNKNYWSMPSCSNNTTSKSVAPIK
jgi:rhamnosyltransferase